MVNSLRSTSPQVLFISDKAFVDFTIPGGVQLCTHEFIRYLSCAGYQVNIFKIVPKISFLKKVKKKMGIEAYDLYNIDHTLEELSAIIKDKNIQYVFFNQINFATNVNAIKARVSGSVKFIGLSHGNESGDYLHDITATAATSILKTWRLGRLIVKEKMIFSKLLDGVITISDQETSINQWIGTQNILYLPRILEPDLLSWQPIANTAGFVGTLDHLPNFGAIELLAKELKDIKFDGKLVIVGGPEAAGEQLASKYPLIEYKGMMTEEALRQEAGTWSLFINPVFWYSRGSSTKLSKAINWGLPVITTMAGTRGYDLTDDALIVRSHTPAGFAVALSGTLSSQQQIIKLKSAAIKNAADFNINNWAGQIPGFLQSL